MFSLPSPLSLSIDTDCLVPLLFLSLTSIIFLLVNSFVTTDYVSPEVDFQYEDNGNNELQAPRRSSGSFFSLIQLIQPEWAAVGYERTTPGMTQLSLVNTGVSGNRSERKRLRRRSQSIKEVEIGDALVLKRTERCACLFPSSICVHLS